MKIWKFTSEENARNFSGRSKSTMILLGDDGKFWVTTFRNAEKLIKCGYETL